MLDLCVELWLHIFLFIDDKDKIVLPSVCRGWREICTMMTIDHINWADYKFSIDAFILKLGRFQSVKSLILNPACLPEYYINGNAEDKHLMKICDMFPNLISISLKCTDITSDGIKIMISKCKNLKHIFLDNAIYGWIYGWEINKLIVTYPNLKSLSLVNVGRIYQSEIPALSNCLKLEYLHLENFVLTFKGTLEILDKCKCLKTLDISNSDLYWSVHHLFMFKKFKEYDVEIIMKIHDDIDSLNLSRITIDDHNIFIDDELWMDY